MTITRKDARELVAASALLPLEEGQVEGFIDSCTDAVWATASARITTDWNPDKVAGYLQQRMQNTLRAPGAARGEVRGGGADGPSGSTWKQQDSKALQQLDGRKFMYANIIVLNDQAKPPVQCRMRALVDTAAGQELIIPLRKAEQLQLLKRSRGSLKGFGQGEVPVIQYAPVLVKLPSDDSNGQEHPFKQADLTVFAIDDPHPPAQQEDLSDFAGLRQPQQLSPEGNLQLTPVHSPPKGDIATAILGIEGLRKLHVTVKPDEALLCPTESGDEWLVV